MWKSVAVLYNNSKLLERKIKKATPFKIASRENNLGKI